MSKRKGLSLEEKRERMLEIFTESSEFFNLKELEKIAPKRKGIVSQSVKEVVTSLVDDGMVNFDKCGNQGIYWCLPSEALQKKKNLLAKLEAAAAEQDASFEKLTAQETDLKVGREETDARTADIAAIGKLEAELAELRSALKRFESCGPAAKAALAGFAGTTRDAANRWTDNVYAMRSYLRDNFGITEEQFDGFGIPAELDYVEF